MESSINSALVAGSSSSSSSSVDHGNHMEDEDDGSKSVIFVSETKVGSSSSSSVDHGNHMEDEDDGSESVIVVSETKVGSSSSSSGGSSKTVEETNLSKYFNNEIQRDDVCEKIKVVDIVYDDCNEETWPFHGLAGIFSNKELVLEDLEEARFRYIKPIAERAFGFFSRLLKTAIFNVPKHIKIEFKGGQDFIETLAERSCSRATKKPFHITKVIEEVERFSDMSLQSIPQVLTVRVDATDQPLYLIESVNMNPVSAVTLVILDILPYLGRPGSDAKKSQVMNLCSKLVSLFEIEEGPVIRKYEVSQTVNCEFSFDFLIPWCLLVLHLLNTSDTEITSAVRLLKEKHSAFILGNFICAVRILKFIGQRHELFDENKMAKIQTSFYTFSSETVEMKAMDNYFLPYQALLYSVILFPKIDFGVVEELRMIFSQKVYSRENISRVLQKNLEKSKKTKVTTLSFSRILLAVFTSLELLTKTLKTCEPTILNPHFGREKVALVLFRNPIISELCSIFNKVEIRYSSIDIEETSRVHEFKFSLHVKNTNLIKHANVRFSYYTELYKFLCIQGGNYRDDKKSGTEKKKARKVPRINNDIFMNICDFLGWSSPKCHKQYISGSHIPKYFNVDQDKRDFVEAISKNAIRELCKFFGMEKELSSKRKTENSPNELESLKRIRS